jgi:hypothetical protein
MPERKALERSRLASSEAKNVGLHIMTTNRFGKSFLPK